MTNRKKTSLVIGATGQDGSLLSAELIKKGYTVYGGFRRGTPAKLWRLEELGVLEEIKLVNLDLTDPHRVMEVISDIKPAEIYSLASESFVADSFSQPRSIFENNCMGTLNLLEAIRISSPGSKLFFASSSEIFGPTNSEGKLESGNIYLPGNPYGLSKLTGQHLVRIYRENYKLRAITGVLFNHESQFRARNFVTRKISFNIARLKVEGGAPIELGRIESARDWGAASDYVKIIRKAMALDDFDDFICASGKLTTVESLLKIAATAAGFEPLIEGKGKHMRCIDKKTGLTLAKVSEKYYRPFDTPPIKGDPSTILKKTNFGKLTDIASVMSEMVEVDLIRRKKGHTHV